jgi:hypothetical protein
MPRWIRIPFVVSLFLQPVVQVLQHSGQVNYEFTAVSALLVCGIYGLIFLWVRKKRERDRLAVVGKKIAACFRENAVEITVDGEKQDIGYRMLTRVGRDDRGLILILGAKGSLWLPTKSFTIPAERDVVFGYLGGVMKRKIPNQSTDPALTSVTQPAEQGARLP